MLEYKIALGFIALLLGVVQYLPYIVSVVRGTIRPHAFSWFAWSLPTWIVFFAQTSSDAGPGLWATGFTAFICTLIFILSLFKGERDIKALDWASLVVSVIGIAAWVVTNNPLWAVILTTGIDLVGFIPTIRKSAQKPYEEAISNYAIGGLKWSFAIAALTAFTPTTLIYPIGMIIGNWGFVSFLMIRRTYYNKTKPVNLT